MQCCIFHIFYVTKQKNNICSQISHVHRLAGACAKHTHQQGRQTESSFGWMEKTTKERAGAGYSPQKGILASQDENPQNLWF